jgi:2-polyprenyl-6-methoxyphenol hydroxylase-like FAD-dependent oxidoreductase
MQSSSIDVLIAGAGPVGLTMAAALNHCGLTCRIVDKAPAPSDKSKALVVWSRTLELLDGLGLAETFVHSGMKINGASVYGNGKRLVHVSIAGVESHYGFPLVIPQYETERLLAEHLSRRGLAIERQVELLTFEQRPDQVVCKLRHADGGEESLAVPWLIGCDGAHSTVRHVLGLPFTGHADPNDWMLADLKLDGPVAADEISVFWHEKGVLVVFPITRDRFRVIADLGTTTEGALPPDPTLADVQAKVDERGPGGLTVFDPFWLANFRINERKVTDYRRGRVALAGDAAHIHSPAGGQGMNTGMQDAFNLAWKLALIQRGEGRAEPLLSSYSVERSAVGDQVLRGAEMITVGATLRNPVAQWLRNHIAPVVTSFGFVQDKLKNAMTELAINYRQSPLSAEKWPRLAGGLPAGDRAPDMPLTRAASGIPTSLLSLTRCNRHALLLLPGAHGEQATPQLLKIAEQVQHAFPGIFSTHLILKTDRAAPGIAGADVWLDAEGLLHQKLHATDRALFVIRPDGYIGFRCQPAEAEEVLNYLERYLIRKNEGLVAEQH